MTGSENGVEFRLDQIAGKYDLTDDTQRIAYAQEVSEELAKLENAVEREVYTTRAAQAAGLTPEAMRLEVERALRRKLGKERKALRRRELNPAVSVQPPGARHPLHERAERHGGGRGAAPAAEGRERLFRRRRPCGRRSFPRRCWAGCLTACGSCGRRDGPQRGRTQRRAVRRGNESSHRRIAEAGGHGLGPAGAGGLYTHHPGGAEAERTGRSPSGGSEKYKAKKRVTEESKHE